MSAEPATPTQDHFISQRLKLRYLDWGNPDKPDLILAHGGQDHVHAWHWIAPEFTKDWHVIAPELRGHGDSDWSSDGNYSITAYVHDFAEFVRQKARPPVTIIAHSLGSVIALRFAALYPDLVRRFVAIEGVSITPDIPITGELPPAPDLLRNWIAETRQLAARTPRPYKTIAEAEARMAEVNPHLTPAQVAFLNGHAVRQTPDGYVWKFDEFTRKRTFVDISKAEERRLMGEIACPVLLIYGADSWLVGMGDRDRVSLFRDAKIITIADAQHWVHLDQTPQFLEAVRGFI